MDLFWTDTTDGELLKTLLGGYPTLMDAVVRRVQFGSASGAVSMLVDHRDESGAVRLELNWTGVQRCELKLDGEPRLYGIDVRRREGLVHCDLIQGMALYGTIVAEHFDVSLIQADPGEDDHPFEIGFI